MRKAARIAGLIWIAVIAVVGVVLLASGRFIEVRILMYALFGLGLPGAFLAHWGKPRMSFPPDPLSPKAPFDRALEAGHVMRIDRDS
jgi:hypothetical protein